MSLSDIQKDLSHYYLTVLVVLGNVGNCLNVIVFSQKTYRMSSVSVYMLALSISSWMFVNLVLIPTIHAADHIDSQNVNLSWCKCRSYIVHVITMLIRSLSKLKERDFSGDKFNIVVIAASIDLWARCTRSVKLRSWCTHTAAWKVIVSLLLFWMVISIHAPLFGSIEKGRCGQFGNYRLAYRLAN